LDLKVNDDSTTGRSLTPCHTYKYRYGFFVSSSY